MSGERLSNFLVPFTTSMAPTVTDPVAAGDVGSLGFNDARYARIESWGDAVDTRADLRAVEDADRFHGQQRLVTDDGAAWFYDSSSSAADDDSTILEPDDSPVTGRWLVLSGGGGGGGGSEIASMPLGEPFLATDVPAAAYIAVKPTLVVTALNKYIDFSEGGGDLLATLTEGTYRFDNSYERAKFLSMLKAALELNGAGTYTPTFDTSTRKIVITSTASVTLKWKTGAHGSDNTDDHAGSLMGWTDASDTASNTTQTATNAIDASFTYKNFAFKTDASYQARSRAFQGVVESAGAQYAEKAVKYNQTIQGYSGLVENEGELYTATGAIVIEAGVNDALDFDEGGGELNGTIPAGSYLHDGTVSHGGLAEAIVTELESVGAGTYSASYDNDTDKWTIARTGGNVAFPFLTGTNNATSIDTTLGYTHTDKASAGSHTATNAIALRGKLRPGAHERVTGASVLGGFSQRSDRAHVKRGSVDRYIEVLNLPGEFAASPTSETVSTDGAIGDFSENAAGYALRVYIEDANVNPNVYRIAYRPSASAAWTVSAFTLSAAKNIGQGGRYVDADGGNTDFKPLIAIDENSLDGVAVFNTSTGGDLRVYAYYTTDGGVTWTKSTGPATDGALYSSAGTDCAPGAIAIRNGAKCGVLINGQGNNDTRLLISTDSGSGFAAFSSFTTSGGTHNYVHNQPVHLFCQYFPGEAGANQYRFVAAGQDSGTSGNAVANYWKGDGSSPARVVGLFSVTTTQRENVYAAAIDRAGDGNRIIFLGGDNDDATHVGLAPAYSNDVYNGGTLTVTGTNTDFTGGLIICADRDNNPTDTVDQITFTRKVRAVLVNGKGYCVATLGGAAGDTTPQVYLFKSNDVTTNTWTLVGQLNGGVAGSSPSMAYIASKHALLMAWKEMTTTANHNTEGQIWARSAWIDGNDVTLETAEQIDGGKAMAGYVGFPLLSPGCADGATVWWLKDTGGSAYHFEYNRFS